MPGEVDGWALLVVDEGACVVEVGRSAGRGKFEYFRELRDLREWREGFGGVGERFEVPRFALLVDDGVNGRGDA